MESPNANHYYFPFLLTKLSNIPHSGSAALWDYGASIIKHLSAGTGLQPVSSVLKMQKALRFSETKGTGCKPVPAKFTDNLAKSTKPAIIKAGFELDVY